MNSVMNKIWGIVEKKIYVIIKKIYEFSGRSLTIETFEAVMQFIKFGVVGLSNTIVSYLIYVVGLIFLRSIGILEECEFLVARLGAFVISVLWSFYWNNKLVFKLQDGEKRSNLKTLIKTYISYSFTGLFLNSVLLILWVRVLHISEFIAPIINLLVSVPTNFVINKFWTFRKKV